MLKKLLSINALKEALSTSTFRQSLVTFGGIVASGGLAAVFYIIAARALGPEGFGILTVALGFLTLVSGISDVGTSTGLVRFVGQYFNKDPQKAKRFLKLGLKIKVLLCLFVLALGFWVIPWVSTVVFTRPELTVPLRIALVGVCSAILFSYITSALQGVQKFWLWSGIQVGTNLVRVAIFLVAMLLFSVSVESTLWIFSGSLLLGFFIGLWFLPKGTLGVNKDTSVLREFFDYNKWVAAFILVAAFSARMDTFISARLLPIAMVGIYGVATQIVAIVPQIVSAISTVIAPKMASMGGVSDLVSYIKKTQVLVLALSLLGILSIPVVLYLIPILFGEVYIEAGPLFVVLLFAQLVYLISVPIHTSVFYYFSYPKLFFWISLGHLAITGGLGWMFISRFGVMGAAFAVLAGSVFNFLVPLVWVLRKVRSAK
jgi:O-antigen/teichoic acid export membrane protein